jgi:hypothetical protein
MKEGILMITMEYSVLKENECGWFETATVAGATAEMQGSSSPSLLNPRWWRGRRRCRAPLLHPC